MEIRTHHAPDPALPAKFDFNNPKKHERSRTRFPGSFAVVLNLWAIAYHLDSWKFHCASRRVWVYDLSQENAQQMNIPGPFSIIGLR